jgi:hypothetical protein
MSQPVSPPPIDNLTALAKSASAKGPPPVHLWHPAYCGEIDMRIASDGTWFYMGTPIGRPALVKLFASILRKDPERYVLVTPVEMVGIVVEDAPFIAVAMERDETASGQILKFRTNVEDLTTIGTEHPLRFVEDRSGGLKPYVHVRGDLWAKVSRPVFYDLVELGEERVMDGTKMFGIASGGAFFPMIEAARLAELT